MILSRLADAGGGIGTTIMNMTSGVASSPQMVMRSSQGAVPTSLVGLSAVPNNLGVRCLRLVAVYDLLADRRTVKINAHADDVNSCCWADTASGNVLISASDDTFLKVWCVSRAAICMQRISMIL